MSCHYYYMYTGKYLDTIFIIAADHHVCPCICNSSIFITESEVLHVQAHICVGGAGSGVK